MADPACLQCMSYLRTPVASTEGMVLSALSYFKIDTFGKWLRCLTNVCYVNTKKLGYLDKLRLSESFGTSGLCFILALLYRTFSHRFPHFLLRHVYALLYWAFPHRFKHNLVAKDVYALLLKSLPGVFFPFPCLSQILRSTPGLYWLYWLLRFFQGSLEVFG